MELAFASARFNLGLLRTTKVPTLPLEFVHPRHRDRMTFKLQGIERVNGRGNGDARYSNFRRFATSARVVPQP